jgi:uncharacterized Rmd1/YagE family protein
MYHLPLLPGYGPNANIRSSGPPKTSDAKLLLSRLEEAEETGYQGTYFTSPSESPPSMRDGYLSSSSPVETRSQRPAFVESDADTDMEPEVKRKPLPRSYSLDVDEVAEVVFFEYGVVVFFGLEEGHELGILEDIGNAGILRRPVAEHDWEIEECHFAVGVPPRP